MLSTGQIFLPPYEIPVLLVAGSVCGQLDSVYQILVLHRAVSWTRLQKFNREYLISSFRYLKLLMFTYFSTVFQCDKYRRGVIDGSACSSLCEKDTLYLEKCFTARPNSQVSRTSPSLLSTLIVNNPAAPLYCFVYFRCILESGETCKD